MTFNQFLALFGLTLAQWLPVCGLMYYAVRKGIEHGSKATILAATRAVDNSIRAKPTPMSNG